MIARPQNRILMHEFRNFNHLGRKCRTNSECKHGAECLYEVCACPPHTIANLSEYCVPEHSRHPLLQRIYNNPTDLPKIPSPKTDSHTQYPGNKCDEDKVCKMGSVCKSILTTTPHCVCDSRLVVNVTGHCTTRLLANTKKSRQLVQLNH